MAKAFYMIQDRYLDPEHEWYKPVIQQYDLFVCNWGIPTEEIRAHVKPGALLFPAINFYSVPQEWGNDTTNPYFVYRNLMDDDRLYYMREGKRLEAGWKHAWLKHGLGVCKRQVNALVTAMETTDRGWDGFYIDMSGDYMPWHLLYRNKPESNPPYGLVSAGIVHPEDVPFEQCRWLARNVFFFQYLRQKLNELGFGKKKIIAQRYEADSSHGLVHDPDRRKDYARPWKQQLDGITIENYHSNRLMEEASRLGRNPETAIMNHWVRQAQLAADVKDQCLSVDWSGRWEKPGVVMKGMIFSHPETWPQELQEGGEKPEDPPVISEDPPKEPPDSKKPDLTKD
jgi:hypothetical protein